MWRATPALVVALDERFGAPADAYVNGSQVWLRDDGPGGMTLEWRLHPVAGFWQPPSVGTYELFETAALALATGTEPPAALHQLWDGLEAFPAFGDETEPALLGAACTDALGLASDACGLVDHLRVADDWERSGRRTSIVADLIAQLTG